MITLGSLFDGAGTCQFAAIQSGIKPMWASEIEPFPVSVTEKRFPSTKHLGDIAKIDGTDIPPVDVISFGSPCQDLSVAGKRAGIQDGERSNLFFEAVRIIKEMREATNGEYPKYAVWENVPGAFSSNKGYDFHAVLEALCSVCDDTVSIPKPYDKRKPDKLIWNGAGEIVGDNYSVAWRTLDAQYWGVPQRRKRIYLVADFTGRRAEEILFKPDSLRGYMPQGNEAGQGSTADVVGSVDGSVGVSNESGIGYWMPGFGCLRAEGENRPSRPTHTIVQSAGFCQGASPAAKTIGYQEEVSPTIKGAPSGTAQVPAVVVVQDGSETARTLAARYDSSPCADRGQNVVVYSFDSLSSNSMKSSNPFSGCRAVDVAKCIDTTYPDPSKNQGGVAVVMATQQGGAEIAEDLCPTITAAAGMSGNNQPVIALQANGIDRAIPINDKATRFSGGGDTRKNDGAGNGLGVGKENGPSPTVTAADRHAVCYDARGNGDGETACFTMQRSDEYQDCAVASTQSARQYKSATDLVVEKKRRYIIRRLTPTECARLQGFPDWWAAIPTLTDMTDEAFDFWQEVRRTHAAVNGKTYKPAKTKKAMINWYNKLHTDSAEYKMWGNGMALPCVMYVFEGVSKLLNRRWLDELLGGDE